MNHEDAKKALREWIEKEEEFIEIGQWAYGTSFVEAYICQTKRATLSVTDAKRLIGLLLDVIDGPSQTESFTAKSQT